MFITIDRISRCGIDRTVTQGITIQDIGATTTGDTAGQWKGAGGGGIIVTIGTGITGIISDQRAVLDERPFFFAFSLQHFSAHELIIIC